MEPLKELNDIITFLPRGGFLVDTSAGYIQFGIPPESIKDTMDLPKGVPQTFVLPFEFFNWIKGISVAELEFPIYYNYFLKNKITRIICSENEVGKFKRILQESLFGPEDLDLSNDFTKESNIGDDIKSEINYFKIMDFSDVVEFCHYDNNQYRLDNVTIEIDSNGNYDIYDNDEYIAHVPGNIEYKPKYLIGERLQEPYKPPLFGITCLGPSHGFDPYENTSGFLIWLNHNGIMVDPPVNSTEWLLDSNISPKFIDSIILTHCHADHDAGTFQKILEEGKITIYSTETIMMSFLRKFSALTDTDTEYLMSLFEFRPIKIGEPIYIHGGCFKIFYTLHSIPAIGFRLQFEDKSLTYSSDHNNDPQLHKKLYNEKIISKKRYDELTGFPWDSTIVFHESGYPPLHTPIEYMDSLPEEKKNKIIVYHISKTHLPENSTLTMAQFGIENTIYFDTRHPKYERSYQILGILKYLDLLYDIPIKKAQEFISIVEEENFNKGDIIIKKDTKGDKFFIIYSGNVSIHSEDGKFKKLFGAYDYFGEAALITGEKRSTNVYAETDVIAFTIEKDKFINFIRGTEYEKNLSHLVQIRDIEAWDILSSSRFLKGFTSTQRTWLEVLLTQVEITGKGELYSEGQEIEHIYLIRKGTVIVSQNGERIAILQKGDIVGSSLDIYKNNLSSYTFIHEDPLSLYLISVKDFKEFLTKNPGLVMKLHYIFSQYLFSKF